ncbi:MAG: ABC transporter substrate-binding protein [Actinomycetota bacterium]
MSSGPLNCGGVPEHFNLPWHLAIEEDLPSGSAVWEDQHGGTGEMLTKLADGELDVVSILTEGTVSAIDDGLDLTMVQVYVASPLQWGVFVPAASRFEAEADLGTARIAISRFNSGSHLMAFIQAERMGWSIDDDRFVVVGSLDGAVAAFAEGRADLFLWEQHMTRPLVTSGAFRQLGVQDTPWPSFVIAARNEVLTGRTTEVGRLVDAVVAQAVGLHERGDAVPMIADRYDLSKETVTAWLATTEFVPRAAMDPTIAPSVLATLARAGFS